MLDYEFLELQCRHEVEEFGIVAVDRVIRDSIAVEEPAVTSLQLKIRRSLVSGDDVQLGPNIGAGRAW